MQFGKHVGKSGTNGMNVQWKFAFPNGYGASVVMGPYTYGGEQGKWELGVLGLDGHLTYATPITTDVIGYLSEQDVADTLDKIEALTPESIERARKDREREAREQRIADLRAELATLEAEVSA